MADTELESERASLHQTGIQDPLVVYLQAARDRLDVGDLWGALAIIKRAEQLVSRGPFTRPSSWCALARFHLDVPQVQEARRCLDAARDLVRVVEESCADDDRAVVITSEELRRSKA